jgi:hypothetical protein
MRTSVTLDDDVYELAFFYAKGRGLTLGGAIGELVRKGQSAPPESPMKGLKRAPKGMLIFAAQPGKVITPEMVKKYQEDDVE